MKKIQNILMLLLILSGAAIQAQNISKAGAETISKTETLAAFYVKGSKELKAIVRIALPRDKAKEAFALSDQALKYDIAFDDAIPQAERSSNALLQLATPVYKGDKLTAIETTEYSVLTYKTATQTLTRAALNIDGPPVQEADGKGTRRTTSQPRTKPDLL
jgi:hypothetical protein